MRVHLATVCLLLIATSPPAFGQDLSDPLLDGDEEISEDFVTDRDEIVLNLNTASVEDLASLPPLSYADAERIVSFRAAHGLFRSPRDLSLIDGLPRPVVEAVLPHVTVGRLEHPFALTSRARFVRRSASARGKSLLTGSSLHSRTTCRAGDLVTASVTTEKDAGERSPLDFAAGYMEVRSGGWMERLVAGDFRPGFAQGLVFSRWGRAPTDLDQVVRRRSRQVGYRSTEENGALRGVYLEGSKGLWRVSAFGSSARLDAARDASGQVERLTEGGLHVTAAERGRADALREMTLGLRVERATDGRSHVGVTALRSGFSPPFKAQERSGFSGAWGAVVGVDGGVCVGGVEIAGEVAQTDRGRAWVTGATFQRRGVKAGVQARDYGPRFQTLHGAGFSTFGESQNERGVFAGLAYKARRIRLASLTFDRAWRPGPTPTLPAGSARASLTFRLQHAPLRGLRVQWSGRVRWDQTWKGKQAGVVQRRRRSLRMDVVRHVGRGLQVHGRGEFVSTTMGSDREAGRSVFGALRVRWGGVRAEGRLTYFNVPSYESRMFEWEDAPEGMMAFRTLTGRGLKGYALMSVKMGASHATLRLWRQRPLDGRKATTEVVAQVDVKM